MPTSSFRHAACCSCHSTASFCGWLVGQGTRYPPNHNRQTRSHIHHVHMHPTCCPSTCYYLPTFSHILSTVQPVRTESAFLRIPSSPRAFSTSNLRDWKAGLYLLVCTHSRCVMFAVLLSSTCLYVSIYVLPMSLVDAISTRARIVTGGC